MLDRTPCLQHSPTSLDGCLVQGSFQVLHASFKAYPMCTFLHCSRHPSCTHIFLFFVAASPWHINDSPSLLPRNPTSIHSTPLLSIIAQNLVWCALDRVIEPSPSRKGSLALALTISPLSQIYLNYQMTPFLVSQLQHQKMLPLKTKAIINLLSAQPIIIVTINKGHSSW